MNFKKIAYPQITSSFSLEEEYPVLNLPKTIKLTDSLANEYFFRANRSRDSYYLHQRDNTYFGIRLNLTETDETLVLNGIYLKDSRINLQNRGLGSQIVGFLVDRAAALDKLFYITDTSNYLLLKMIRSRFPFARFQVYADKQYRKFVAEGYFDRFSWLQSARNIKVTTARGDYFFKYQPGSAFCSLQQEPAVQLLMDDQQRIKLFVYDQGNFREIEIERILLENIFVNIVIDPKYRLSGRLNACN